MNRFPCRVWIVLISNNWDLDLEPLIFGIAGFRYPGSVLTYGSERMGWVQDIKIVLN